MKKVAIENLFAGANRYGFLPALLQDGFLVEAGIAERKTAAVYLKRLEDIGVLKSVKAGRERIFLIQSS